MNEPSCLKKAIVLDEKVLAREPKHIAARENLATSKINLADFARARGDIDEALKYNREAIAMLESVVADEPAEMEHKKTLWNASYNAAFSLLQVGRASEALEISRRIYPVAVELREKHTADRTIHRFRRPYLSRALAGGSLMFLGKYEEAIAEFQAAIQDTKARREQFPRGSFGRWDESVFTFAARDRAGTQQPSRRSAIEAMTTVVAMGPRAC